MKKIIFILMMSSVMNSYSESLPFWIYNQSKDRVESVKIERKKYKKLIKRSLKKAIKNDKGEVVFNQEWLVIGFGADVRVGFFDWRISPSLAMEFHLRRLP